MRTLRQIFNDHKYAPDYGDKGSVHTYIDEYETLLFPYKTGCSVLEIGLEHGGSLKMWNEYFTNSQITGITLYYPTYLTSPHSLEDINNNKINVIINNACSSEILSSVEHFGFDVIIDDGSHLVEEQIASFNLFKRRMNKGGIYVIEDIQDLERDKETYEKLHDNLTIIDNRHINNRWDDIMLVYKF
jgi:hypothetical protein